MKTITFPSGVYFTKKSEMVNSLFVSGGTASGYFQRFNNGILFNTPTGEPKIFQVANSYNEIFFVSCSRQIDGKIRYSFSTTTKDDQWLGLDSIGWIAQHELAEKIWKELA